MIFSPEDKSLAHLKHWGRERRAMSTFESFVKQGRHLIIDTLATRFCLEFILKLK